MKKKLRFKVRALTGACGIMLAVSGCGEITGQKTKDAVLLDESTNVSEADAAKNDEQKEKKTQEYDNSLQETKVFAVNGRIVETGSSKGETGAFEYEVPKNGESENDQIEHENGHDSNEVTGETDESQPQTQEQTLEWNYDNDDTTPEGDSLTDSLYVDQISSEGYRVGLSANTVGSGDLLIWKKDVGRDGAVRRQFEGTEDGVSCYISLSDFGFESGMYYTEIGLNKAAAGSFATLEISIGTLPADCYADWMDWEVERGWRMVYETADEQPKPDGEPQTQEEILDWGTDVDDMIPGGDSLTDSLYVDQISSEGYRVGLYTNMAESGDLLIWKKDLGHDSAIWRQLDINEDGISCYISLSDFGFESGMYYTEIGLNGAGIGSFATLEISVGTLPDDYYVNWTDWEIERGWRMVGTLDF